MFGRAAGAASELRNAPGARRRTRADNAGAQLTAALRSANRAEPTRACKLTDTATLQPQRQQSTVQRVRVGHAYSRVYLRIRVQVSVNLRSRSLPDRSASASASRAPPERHRQDAAPRRLISPRGTKRLASPRVADTSPTVRRAAARASELTILLRVELALILYGGVRE